MPIPPRMPVWSKSGEWMLARGMSDERRTLSPIVRAFDAVVNSGGNGKGHLGS
jgi:hypothetical protein